MRKYVPVRTEVLDVARLGELEGPWRRGSPLAAGGGCVSSDAGTIAAP